jgi:hypothetical protein
MEILGGALAGRSATHEKLVSGKADVDGDAVTAPLAMTMTREIENDMARSDALEEALELRGAPPGVSLEGAGVSHASERELERYLHGVSHSYLHGSCALTCASGGGHMAAVNGVRVLLPRSSSC